MSTIHWYSGLSPCSLSFNKVFVLLIFFHHQAILRVPAVLKGTFLWLMRVMRIYAMIFCLPFQLICLFYFTSFLNRCFWSQHFLRGTALLASLARGFLLLPYRWHAAGLCLSWSAAVMSVSLKLWTWSITVHVIGCGIYLYARKTCFCLLNVPAGAKYVYIWAASMSLSF